MKWLLTWPKITFLVVNIALFVFAVVPVTPMLKYSSSKLLILTLVIPTGIWVIINTWLDRYQHGRIGTVVAICFFVAMLLADAIFFGVEFSDVFHKPVYITGKVESVTERHRGPTRVDLDGDDQRYSLYQFKIEIEPGKTYRFRFMPNSRNLIPIEELPDSVITEG